MARKIFNDDGSPKWVRIYDNGGGSFDRYTAVFTGNYKNRPTGLCEYISFNTPASFWMHEESRTIIDRPAYSHLGKQIGFYDIPVESQGALMADYKCAWGEV
jgi:hypothetical protein